jgi:hypothetical protein
LAIFCKYHHQRRGRFAIGWAGRSLHLAAAPAAVP